MRETRVFGFCAFLLLTGVVASFSPLQAEPWPGWRGPRWDGTSKETGIPTSFSDTKNVRWKLPLGGIGHSSPVVWGDKVFVTWCTEKEELRVLACVDRVKGTCLWKKTVLKAPLERKHRLNSYSSATPATDGKHVWVAFMDFPKMVVACYDFEGKEIWRATPGKIFSKHGFCSSPVLYKNLLILNGDQDANGYLVALNKTTGKEVWRTPRPNRTRSYCTPLLVHAADRDQLVMSGSRCVTGYDPATGKQLWIIDGPTEQYVASLVFTENVLFMTAGFPEYHLMGIRPDGKGNITRTHVLWHHDDISPKEASYVPSPLAKGKYFYVVSDRGYASCFEAKTGKRLWMQKLGRRHSSSPVLVEDRIYFPSDEGDVYVVKTGPKFELLSKNRMRDECYASPAISQGEMYLRTQNFLFCISEQQSTKK